ALSFALTQSMSDGTPKIVHGTLELGVNSAVKPLSFIFPSVHSVWVYSAFGVPPSPHMSAIVVGMVGFVDLGVCNPGVKAFTSAMQMVLLKPSLKLRVVNLLLG